MWNYRIIKHDEPDNVTWYGIHEVYYSDNTDREPKLWSEKPIRLTSDDTNFTELFKMLETANDKPILKIVGETLIPV